MKLFLHKNIDSITRKCLYWKHNQPKFLGGVELDQSPKTCFLMGHNLVHLKKYEEALYSYEKAAKDFFVDKFYWWIWNRVPQNYEFNRSGLKCRRFKFLLSCFYSYSLILFSIIIQIFLFFLKDIEFITYFLRWD